MVIKTTFLGKDISFPSGNGPTKKTCPKCNDNKLYAQYGWSDVLDKPIFREFCIKKDNPCDYYKDNLTDDERKIFSEQFKKDME